MAAGATSNEQWVTLEEIDRARRALPPVVRRTPLLPCPALEAVAHGPVLLKAESLQVTGSYKPRASYTLLANLPAEQRRRGVIIPSSGNFAIGVAFMGKLLGIPVVAVMMEGCSPLKLEAVRALGAEVVQPPRDLAARAAAVAALERGRGLTVVRTFEDPLVMTGHASIGLEIGEDAPGLGTILVPVSSGGLVAGIATAAKALRPGVRVIGVQPEQADGAVRSFRAGKLVEIPTPTTLADALVSARPGAFPFRHIRRYVDDMVTVTEEEIVRAVRFLATEAKLVVEPGGAVGVAALLAGRIPPGPGPTVAVLSGGNVDPDLLAKLLGSSS